MARFATSRAGGYLYESRTSTKILLGGIFQLLGALVAVTGLIDLLLNSLVVIDTSAALAWALVIVGITVGLSAHHVAKSGLNQQRAELIEWSCYKYGVNFTDDQMRELEGRKAVQLNNEIWMKVSAPAADGFLLQRAEVKK